jgi:hypothetical protein
MDTCIPAKGIDLPGLDKQMTHVRLVFSSLNVNELISGSSALPFFLRTEASRRRDECDDCDAVNF